MEEQFVEQDGEEEHKGMDGACREQKQIEIDGGDGSFGVGRTEKQKVKAVACVATTRNELSNVSFLIFNLCFLQINNNH